MDKTEKNIGMNKLCLILLLSFIFIPLSAVPAHAMTKQQVKSKMAELQKEINDLEKQYESAKASRKSQTVGLISVFGGVKCRDPFILESIAGTYYWVNQPGNLDDGIIMASGYVRKTGNYRVYNGITCVECNAVKVQGANRENSILEKLEDKKSALKKYKKALKAKVILPSQKTIFSGKTEKIPRDWKNGGSYYNKLIWKSSNQKVVAVDQNGKITAKSRGKATITAKASISGKISKCAVTVQQPVTSLAFEQEKYDISGKDIKDSYYHIRLHIQPDTVDEEISIISSDKSTASFVSRSGDDITLKIEDPGKATITAKTKSGVKAKCVVTYFGNTVNSIFFGQEKYQAVYSEEGDYQGVYSDDGYLIQFIEVSISLDDLNKKMDDSLRVYTTNTDVAVYNDYESNGNKLAFEILGAGTTTITVESSLGVMASCILEVTARYDSDYADSDYNDSDYANSDDDDY